MSKVTGRDKRVADWLETIGIDPKVTRRVVIDIPCNGAVVMYVERFGDSSMFEVEPPPDLITAIIVGQVGTDFEEAVRLINELKSDEQQVKGAKEPTPEWLAEYQAKQQEAIGKWEHSDD